MKIAFKFSLLFVLLYVILVLFSVWQVAVECDVVNIIASDSLVIGE